MKTIKNLTADQLRKSILQLAIEGKLVKQDPNDEPASELVKKIMAEKKRLIQEGKIKKDKNESYIYKGDDNCYYEKIGNNAPVKLEDLPFDIPDNWTWIRLKNLCQIIFSGKSPKYSKDKTNNIAIGQAANTGINIDLSLAKYCTDDFVKDMPDFYYLKKNDVLLNTLGHGTLGRCGIYELDKNDVLTDGHLFVFRLFNNITAIMVYKYLFLNRTKIEKSSNGTTNQIFLNLSTVGDYLFPLAPLEEQQHIVDKINSFEPLILQYENAESKLSILETEFPEKLKKSILQYAIEGKLVKQDPNDEPASVLLERIKAEKERLIKEGKIKRDKNESYIYQGDDKNYYENLPESYVVTYLSSAGNWRSGATPQRGNNEYYGGDIAWIKTGELNNATIYDSVEKVTRAALSKCSLPINDIGNVLIAMYGATIGKIAIAGIPLTTNQACCGCKPFSGINNKYLFYYLMANKQRFIDSAEGGAQPNISREKIIAYPFVLPPYNEQIRIAKKLEFILGQIPC